MTCDDSQQRIACETLVQLDGDVVSWISHEALLRPELLTQHHDAIRERLRSASKLARHGIQSVATAALAVRWGGAASMVLLNATLWSTIHSYLWDLAASAASLALWHFGCRFAGAWLARRALEELGALSLRPGSR